MGEQVVRILVCLVVLAFVGAWLYDSSFSPNAHSYLLAVKLEPRDGRQVVRVWPTPMTVRRDEAERFQELLRRGEARPYQEKDWYVVDKFDGGWFRVPCDCWEPKSGFGRDLGYTEVHQTVALRVEFADGGQEWVVVTIPEGRGDRSVTVPVP